MSVSPLLPLTASTPKTSAEFAPPAASSFPKWPASWYLFGRSDELRAQPVSKTMLGRRIVAFRGASGKVAVLDAHCAHLGADLGKGCIDGDALRCPFHSWEYGADGRCTRIPGLANIPSFARQTAYPVEERHGYVFFFFGREPLFPLPFFVGDKPEDFSAGRSFSYVADCEWFMNSAHAFDTQHFASVHDRRLTAPPEIDEPAPFARRNRYRAEIIGKSIFDRVLQRFASPTVEITITTWGGTFVMITGDFGKVQSRFAMVTRPLENGETLCEGIVFARNGSRILNAPRLCLRRLFTHAYLADEAQRLRGTRYRPHAFIQNDRDMVDYFHWLTTLPQS